MGSLALDGDTVVIAARLDGVGAAEDQGSAYVFTRSGSTWTEQQKLVASDGAAEDRFGNDVALSGDTAVVGEFFHDPRGAAYVFTRSGATWTEQQKLVPSGAPGLFGSQVAVDGNTGVIASKFGQCLRFYYRNNRSRFGTSCFLTSSTLGKLQVSE